MPRARDAQGIVERISTKEIEDRKTGEEVVLYSIKLDDDEWYGCGRKDPPCDEGDEVEFQYSEKNGYFNIDMDTFENLSGDEGNDEEEEERPRRGRSKKTSSRRSTGRRTSGSSSGSSRSRSSGGSSKATDAVGKKTTRDDYWKEKEQRDFAKEQRYQEVVEPRITFCSAQSDAVALVAAMLAHDGAQADTKDKILPMPAKGKRLDYIQEVADQLTARFYEQRISGDFATSGGVTEEDPDVGEIDDDEGEDD
jgi:hypothetical protein